MTAPARLMLLSMVALCVAGAVAQTGDVEGLIADLSSEDADLRLSSARELGELGPEPLVRLLTLVAGDDQRVAAGARVAVGVLVHNLVAPGAPEGCKAAAQVLLKTATGAGSIGLRRFALRQLAVVGEDDSVPGLTDLLGDPEVAEMARYALARIPGSCVVTGVGGSGRVGRPTGQRRPHQRAGPAGRSARRPDTRDRTGRWRSRRADGGGAGDGADPRD